MDKLDIPEKSFRIEYIPNPDSNDLENFAIFRAHDFIYTRKFYELQKKLKTEHANEAYFMPEEGQIFAYYQGQEWRRVYLIRRKLYNNFRDRRLEIFVIDYGYLEDIIYDPQPFFQPLPKWFSPEELDSQSYKITLYGVVPESVEIQIHGNPHKKRRPFWEWEAYKLEFMKKKMQEATRIYFEQVFQEGEVKFGYIFLEEDGSFHALHELLIEESMAVRVSESEFETKEIPELLKQLRTSPDFDCKISVRKRLYPSFRFTIEEKELRDKREMRKKSKLCKRPTSLDNDVLEEEIPNLNTRVNMPFMSKYQNQIHSNETSEIQLSEISECSSETSESSKNAIEHVFEDEHGIQPQRFSVMCDEILILGNDDYFKPTPFMHTTPLDEKTLKIIDKCKLRDINRSQGFMIPAMLSGRDIVFVDAPRNGKTVACVISLISLLRRSNENKRPGISPRSLYILPYSSRCETVRNRCVELITGRMDGYDEDAKEYDLRVTTAYGCGVKLEHDKLTELAVGYDILVCTPRCLVRLLQKRAPAFDLSRLEYVVFDDYHILHTSFAVELKEITVHLQKLKRKQFRQIFISNSSSEVKPIIDMGIHKKGGIVLIPCFLEAALLPGFIFDIRYRTDASKILKEIRDVVYFNSKLNNIVIVFNDLSDDDKDIERFEELYYKLSSSGRPVYRMRTSNYMKIEEEVAKFKENARSEERPILICTDNALDTAIGQMIREADCLIHYSLPQDMKVFRQRFSVLLHRTQELANNLSSQKPEVLLYINECSAKQFPRLLELMSRLKVDLPLRIQDLLKQISNQREIARQDICINLKHFGKCDNKKTCEYRHVFTFEKDRPDPILPTFGQIEIDIVHVYSPTHFRVRLLKHKNANGEWTRLPILDSKVLTMKLGLYFDKNSVRALESVKEGDLVAVAHTETSSTISCYKRVRVMKIFDGKPKKAALKFVDSGQEIMKPVAALCQLPVEFASIPETTVDVFVCNLQPIDEDITWGEIFSRIMEQKIREEKMKKGIKFIGNIQLVIGRTLWLDPLHCYSYSKLLKEDMMEPFSVSRYLLTEKLAIRNENHLKVLRQKCQVAGLLSSNGAATEEELPNSQNPEKTNEKSSSVNFSIVKESNDIAQKENIPPSYIQKDQTTNSRKKYTPPAFLQNGSLTFKKPSRPAPKRRLISATNKSIMPTIWWRQDGTSVTMIIKKNITEDYSIITDGSRRICFQGWEGKCLYKFEETLRARFNEKTIQHRKSGVTVVIKVDKLSKEIRWDRLMKNMEREKWVKREIDDSDEDSDHKPPAELLPKLLTWKNLPNSKAKKNFVYTDFTPPSSEDPSDEEDDPIRRLTMED